MHMADRNLQGSFLFGAFFQDFKLLGALADEADDDAFFGVEILDRLAVIAGGF